MTYFAALVLSSALLVSATVTPSGDLHLHGNSEGASCNAFEPLAITWAPVEVECPICKTKNVFMQWLSFGSYIYQHPSKYQLIFWPDTDSLSWYSCRQCRFTVFVEDFKPPPADKLAQVKKVLEEIKLPPQKLGTVKEMRENPPYLAVPSYLRLQAAEKIYRAMDQGDDQFWNHFYRVLAYHLELGKKLGEADDARRKALAISERLAAETRHEGRRKELLYIVGAMKYFLRDRVGALKTMEEARKLSFSLPEMKPEENKGYDEYLTGVIKEYIDMLEKGEGPKN